MNQNDGRIIDLPLAETASDDDYLMLDGVANGTRKIRKDKVGTTGISITQAEYDALTEEQKMNGTVYYITDAESNEETELWTKVGRQTLSTESQVLSGAVNELKASIDDVEADMTYESITIPSSNINSKITVNSVYGGVRGGVAEFYLQGTANASISAWESLVTALPNELKPRETNNAYFININNVLYVCNLNSAGVLNTPQAISSGQIIRFKATYII